jgi:hypothetical protein
MKVVGLRLTVPEFVGLRLVALPALVCGCRQKIREVRAAQKARRFFA